MSSIYDTKTYCRQSLIGGNYGLLNTTTFEPNPDYYSALLWHRLMGKKVLSTRFLGTKKIRAYVHCAKESVSLPQNRGDNFDHLCNKRLVWVVFYIKRIESPNNNDKWITLVKV
ncbi:putative glycosidase [Helianthus annuus]|nr:putative glycosidase [Helianthus annuus]